MAIWIGPGSEYTTAANWDTVDVPNSAGETAEFANNGSTSVTIGSGVSVGGFTFNAGAPTYTISLGTDTVLDFAGAGIVNNSGAAQHLSTGPGASGVRFFGSSSAGDATITITSDPSGLSQVGFYGSSSGGTARIINNHWLFLGVTSGTFSIGSLEGNGGVFSSSLNGGSAAKILSVGSLNTSTTFSGTLENFSASLGLTKVGTGTLTLSGASTYTLATTVSAGTLKAGATNAFASTSAYTVDNGAVLDLNGFSQVIGSLAGVAGASVTLGGGTLTIDGGTTTYAGNITGTGGLVIAAPSFLTLSGTNSYSGATTVNGMLAVSGGNAIGDASAVTVNSAANLFFQASETIGSLAGGGSAEGAGTLTVGADNTSTSFSGFIADLLGAAALTKIGTGTQILSGANIYTGATTINGGTLQVDGPLVFSTTTVNSGGTLAGDGSVHDVIVNSGGHVAPGASPGSLVTGDFTLNAGSYLDIEIAFNGFGGGPISDQLIVTGTVTLGGKLTTRIIDSAFHPATGTAFTIIDNDLADAVTGTFAGLSEGAFFTHNGSSYSISYVGGDGNDVVLTAANDAPVITLAGNLDALVANGLIDNVSVLIGNGTGGFTAAPVGTGDAPRSVALGDVDGDGDLDALVANQFSNNVSVLIGNGAGGFTATTPVGVGDGPLSVALGDVNGDGDLDALVANQNSDNVSVLLGNGAGGFTATTPVGVGDGPLSVALGDVNGDGDLDALVANQSSDNVSVLLGNGAGGFTATTPVGVGDGPISVALGDVNGDGNLDALVVNLLDDTVNVLIGDGAGGFTAATPVGVGDNPLSVALGDVDGDGDLDALVANGNSNNVSVLIGNGAGGFNAATPVGVGTFPLSVALGDVDGDGDLDALVANGNSNNVSVLIGDGTGGFTAVTPVGVGINPQSVALGDLDNAQVTDEDTAFVFSTANGNAITVLDRENSNLNVDETVTLAVQNGILTLAMLAGLTGVSGDGTDTVTFTGTLAEINAALNGLSYTPDEHFNGRDTLSVTANDNAGAAVGGPKTATKLVPIIVNAVNDPVTALDDAFFQNETFGINANILVNNPDGHAFSVTAVNGVAANVGQQVTLASGATLTLNADGTFVYDPNGVFDALPAAGSGASNLTATDSFTYTITGGSTATITINITGIDSDDILRGTAGNDALAGGIGNDSYFVENFGDAITETAGQGTLDRVYASVSYVLDAGDDIETMSTINSLGTGAINLGGNERAQTIYGNAGINSLKGGGGNDVLSGLAGDDTLNGGGDDDRLYGGTGQNDMAGGTGNDWYIVDSLTDVITEAAGGGTLDRVFTTLSYTLTAGAHVEIMSPTTIFTGAINLTGNELANTIYGNGNTNVLGGAAGNDLLVGLGGADTLNGGDGDDRLLGGDGDDTLNGGNNNDLLQGEAGDDVLNGGMGNDRLQGGAGQNDMAGGAGDDVYFVSSTTDTVADAAGQGALDRVYTNVSFALAVGAQIEFMAADPIAGTGAMNLTGNEFANAIYGNNGANIIAGKAGNDTLSGRGGADRFVFDTFAHTTANRDIITDFNGAEDFIRLAKSTFTKLTGNAGTTLSADQFVIGPDALDANDRILYSNGALIYDHNGNAAGGEQLIAVLAGRPTLSNADILLG